MPHRIRILLVAVLLAFGLPLHMAAGQAMAGEPVPASMIPTMQGDCCPGADGHARRDHARSGEGFLAASCQSFCNSAAALPDQPARAVRLAIYPVAFMRPNAAVPTGCDLPPEPAPPRLA